MQNLFKSFGFHEDAQILWLGCWELGMSMGFFGGFPLFLVFFHEGKLGGFLMGVDTLRGEWNLNE